MGIKCTPPKKRIVLKSDLDFKKIGCAIDDLGDADKENGDFFEDFGILIGDLEDCAKATSLAEFNKQKKDLLNTIKLIEKAVRHRLVYKK